LKALVGSIIKKVSNKLEYFGAESMVDPLIGFYFKNHWAKVSA